MSFDENYYQNKKKQLDIKITKKVFDFYNQTKQLLISIDQDITGINQDMQELEQQIKESQKNEKIKVENGKGRTKTI